METSVGRLVPPAVKEDIWYFLDIQVWTVEFVLLILSSTSNNMDRVFNCPVKDGIVLGMGAKVTFP